MSSRLEKYPNQINLIIVDSELNLNNKIHFPDAEKKSQFITVASYQVCTLTKYISCCYIVYLMQYCVNGTTPNIRSKVLWDIADIVQLLFYIFVLSNPISCNNTFWPDYWSISFLWLILFIKATLLRINTWNIEIYVGNKMINRWVQTSYNVTE